MIMSLQSRQALTFLELASEVEAEAAEEEDFGLFSEASWPRWEMVWERRSFTPPPPGGLED